MENKTEKNDNLNPVPCIDYHRQTVSTSERMRNNFYQSAFKICIWLAHYRFSQLTQLDNTKECKISTHVKMHKL